MPAAITLRERAAAGFERQTRAGDAVAFENFEGPRRATTRERRYFDAVAQEEPLQGADVIQGKPER